MMPSNFWLVLDDRLPLRRAIKRPDVRAALPPETLAELRADAERLRELTGRDFSNWKIWDRLSPRRGSADGPSRSRTSSEHEHPGGSGAVLGVRLLRYSGVQGSTLVISNLIQLVSVMVVAAFLGPAELAPLRAAALPRRARHPAALAAGQAGHDPAGLRRRRRRGR